MAEPPVLRAIAVGPAGLIALFIAVPVALAATAAYEV